MIVARDRHHFLQQLLVAEVIARRGEGPLARKHWPPPPRRGGARAAEVDPVVAPVTTSEGTQGGGSR